MAAENVAVAPVRESATPTKVRYWVIVFAVTLAVITYIDRVAMSTAAPFIKSELHLDARQMGLALSAFAWSYALFEIPSGFLGDWLGPRKVLMRIVLWWSAFTALVGQITSLPFLLTVQFLFGAGEAGCFPNVTKAFCIWLPKGERTRAQGWMWFSARWGGAFTPSLVALLITVVGWRHSFEIFGSLGLIWAFFFYRWFRDNPLENPSLNQAERDLLRENASLGHGHSNVPWKDLVTSPSVLYLCAQYFCLSYGWYFYITWLPTYLREGRHMQFATSAILGGLPLFMGGLGNPVAVFFTKVLMRRNGDIRKTRRIMAYIGFAGASTFVLVSTTMPTGVLAVCCMALASFFNDLTMPGSWATCIDVGGRYAGTLSGSMNMCGNLGGALCPVVIGFILSASHNNWNLAFYVSAAVYAMGIFWWTLIDPSTPFERAAIGVDNCVPPEL